MIDKLTILIPVYNDDASSLVQALVAEARNVIGLDYEIIVFDDGSTDARCIHAQCNATSGQIRVVSYD